MILEIHSSQEPVVIRLSKDGKTITEKIIHDRYKKWQIISVIRKMVKNQGGWQKLEQIQTDPGPGSYTGLRLGITIANTLAYSLKIPLNNLPFGKFLQPKYGQPPQITHPK